MTRATTDDTPAVGGGPALSPRRAYAEASKELLRTTVLSAANELAAVRPWSSITMAQIATAAGVSRQTLYNEFGNRDELATAYVLWASDEFLDEIERTISGHDGDLRSALTTAFALFLQLAAEHPLVRALGATTGAEGLHALVATAAGAPVIVAATDRLDRIAADAAPELAAGPRRVACEMIVRLAISHLTVPTVCPADAAAQVDSVLGPFLSSLTPPG